MLIGWQYQAQTYNKTNQCQIQLYNLGYNFISFLAVLYLCNLNNQMMVF